MPKPNEKCLVVVSWFNLRRPYSKVLEGILHIIKISSSYNVTFVLVVVHLFPEKTNLWSKSCLRNGLFPLPILFPLLSSPLACICLAYERQQKTMFSSRSQSYCHTTHKQQSRQGAEITCRVTETCSPFGESNLTPTRCLSAQTYMQIHASNLLC